MDNNISYFTSYHGYQFSLSNANFQYNDKKTKYMTEPPSKIHVPSLPLFLHKETNIYQNTVSSLKVVEVESSRTRIDRFSNEDESGCCKVNLQNETYVTKNSQQVDDVNTSTENCHYSSDDAGFYSSAEENVPDVLDTRDIGSEFHEIGKNQWNTSRAGLSKMEINLSKCCQAENLIDTLHIPDKDKHATQALLNNNTTASSTPSTTISCLPTNQPKLSLEAQMNEVNQWYIVVDKMGMKEKLTYRQLLQMAGMMTLGFIFVAFIVVWVLSPILF